MAITIDDLPGRDSAAGSAQVILNRIQKTILSEKAPATGFVIGQLVSETVSGKNAIEDWAKSGLALGNHTWSHKKYSSVGSTAFIEEVQKTEILLAPLRKQYGPWPLYFRFPMLDQGNTKEQEDSANQYFKKTQTLLGHVSVDTSDWAFADYYENALKNKQIDTAQKISKLYRDHIIDCIDYAEAASGGIFQRQIAQIILLHANALNAANLPALLKTLKLRHYRFISLQEALSDAVYQPHQHKIVYQPAVHFYFQYSKISGKHLPLGPDRTSYKYFREFWEPKIKDLILSQK